MGPEHELVSIIDILSGDQKQPNSCNTSRWLFISCYEKNHINIIKYYQDIYVILKREVEDKIYFPSVRLLQFYLSFLSIFPTLFINLEIFIYFISERYLLLGAINYH